eukprot:g10539.t1
MPTENDEQHLHGIEPRLDTPDDSDDHQKVIDLAAEEACRALKFRERTAEFGEESRASVVPPDALEEIRNLSLEEEEVWIALYVASLSGERERRDFRDPIDRVDANEELKSLLVIFTDPKNCDTHDSQLYTQDFQEEAPLVICWRNCPSYEDRYSRRLDGTYFQFAGFFPTLAALPSCVLTNNLFTGTHARQLYDKNSITLHESFSEICRQFDFIVQELARRAEAGTLPEDLAGRVLFVDFARGGPEDSGEDDDNGHNNPGPNDPLREDRWDRIETRTVENSEEFEDFCQSWDADDGYFVEDFCVVCCNDLFEGDTASLCKLPTCGHYFHEHCLRGWFARAGTCPICRTNLNADLE